METMTESSIGCVKAATKILGDKWTPQLLRFFLNTETVRFCQLQDMVGSINPRTLSARLTTLEREGIIARTFPLNEKRCEYTLTKKGKALRDIIRDMETWSARYT